MRQVRKIKPTRRSMSGNVSYQGLPIAFESSLERDFIIYHSFKNGVIDIVPQPIAIPFNKLAENKSIFTAQGYYLVSVSNKNSHFLL